MWTFLTMKTYPMRQRFHNGSIGKTKEKRLPGTKTYMNVNNILALRTTLQHNNLASFCLTVYICTTKRED